MRALSIRIRYLLMHALSKDPFKHSEHTLKELMRARAYASKTFACTEHTHKELMRMLTTKIQAIENLTLRHL
jgi:hypothetical protein